MAIRKPGTTRANLPERPKVVREEIPNTDDSDEDLEQLEEEFHTGSEDEDVEEEAVEYHTESEDAEADALTEQHYSDPGDEDDLPEAADYDAQALPAELLKSKPSEAPASTTLQWDKLTQKEKKAIRDERGISMRALREEALRTGALQAGIFAQIRRGVRPANKVAGSRIAKKGRKKKSKDAGVVLSGKQKLLQDRERTAKQSGKGSIRPKTKSRSKG